MFVNQPTYTMKRIIPMACIVLASCNSNSRYTREDTVFFDSIAKSDSIRLEIKKSGQRTNDSITNLYALSNIKFEISEKEFERQAEIYKSKVKNNGQYQIGRYTFWDIRANYFQKKLYQIRLYGKIISYNEYDSEITDQYQTLGRSLIEKYGQPVEDVGLPKWHTTESDHWYRLAYWQSADKVIAIYLTSHRTDYSIDLVVYRSDLARLNNIVTEGKKMMEEHKAQKAL